MVKSLFSVERAIVNSVQFHIAFEIKTLPPKRLMLNFFFFSSFFFISDLPKELSDLAREASKSKHETMTMEKCEYY